MEMVNIYSKYRSSNEEYDPEPSNPYSSNEEYDPEPSIPYSSNEEYL